jgi:2-succinyl-5-enolpyruvyl-6-hydroxy-3-cyclohexene-1-carboxylate synthase
VADAIGPAAGPVHLNFPFDKPLEPTDVPDDLADTDPVAATGRPDGAPFVEVRASRVVPSEETLALVTEMLSAGEGVIVAGPTADPDRVGPAARALAAATGFPLLADALSGARFGPAGDVHVVAAYDLFLREPGALEALRPAVVLRVGASPTSAALLAWLSRHADAHQVVVDDGARWKDHGVTAATYVKADAAATLEALARRVRGTASEQWTAFWRQTEAAALGGLEAAGGDPYEGEVWPPVLAAVPRDGALFVSNSMPVRDLDGFGHPRDTRATVLGNRGASGIDGIVSTAFGIASQKEGVVVCVLGDLAFFHDQNGLLWAREQDAPVVFVLIDNDGGGIFHMLPVAGHEPHFTPLVATPHGLDLRRAAELHGIGFEDTTIPELGRALERAVAAGHTTVLRVRTERAANQRRREQIVDSVKRSVREALG